MAGYSVFVCIFLCALAHGFPLPDEREALAVSEVTFSGSFKEDDLAALDRASFLIIISIVIFAIALGIFMTCVYYFLRLLEKDKSPENKAEQGFAGETLGRRGNYPATLQRPCSRCPSPSMKCVGLGVSCEDGDENPSGSLSPLSTPPSPGTDEYRSCPSLNRAMAEGKITTERGTPGGNGLVAPTGGGA